MQMRTANSCPLKINFKDNKTGGWVVEWNGGNKEIKIIEYSIKEGNDRICDFVDRL